MMSLLVTLVRCSMMLSSASTYALADDAKWFIDSATECGKGMDERCRHNDEYIVIVEINILAA